MNDQTTKARQILDTVIYSTIATCDAANMPWAAPQFTVYDPQTKAMYWCASRMSQHGQNILHNHNAYITTYDSMAAPGQGVGVYMRADANVVTDEAEIAHAHDLLLQRHAGVPYWSLQDITAPGALNAIFKAKVVEAWLNEGREDSGQFVLYRQPVEL